MRSPVALQKRRWWTGRAAACWRTAVGQKSSCLARNYREILKDKLECLQKGREAWSSSQWWREFVGKWRSPLICCAFLNQRSLTQSLPQGEDEAGCAFNGGQMPTFLMWLYWFSWLLSQLDFTLLSVAEPLFYREDKGTMGYKVSQYPFQKVHKEKELIFTISSFGKIQ